MARVVWSVDSPRSACFADPLGLTGLPRALESAESRPLTDSDAEVSTVDITGISGTSGTAGTEAGTEAAEAIDTTENTDVTAGSAGAGEPAESAESAENAADAGSAESTGDVKDAGSDATAARCGTAAPMAPGSDASPPSPSSSGTSTSRPFCCVMCHSEIMRVRRNRPPPSLLAPPRIAAIHYGTATIARTVRNGTTATGHRRQTHACRLVAADWWLPPADSRLCRRTTAQTTKRPVRT